MDARGFLLQRCFGEQKAEINNWVACLTDQVVANAA